MLFRHGEIVNTGAVAIGRIEVLRMHAAGIYVAPAIGEFFDCKCLRSEREVFFLGQQDDTKRAHLMLATIRSAMEREFVDFLEHRRESCEHPRTLANSFAQGMGHRISERLRRLKSGRAANALARGKDLGNGAAKLFRGFLYGGKNSKPSGTAVAHWAGVEAGSRVRLD
jgi:hypothetical protein